MAPGRGHKARVRREVRTSYDAHAVNTNAPVTGQSFQSRLNHLAGVAILHLHKIDNPKPLGMRELGPRGTEPSILLGLPRGAREN